MKQSLVVQLLTLLLPYCKILTNLFLQLQILQPSANPYGSRCTLPQRRPRNSKRGKLTNIGVSPHSRQVHTSCSLLVISTCQPSPPVNWHLGGQDHSRLLPRGAQPTRWSCPTSSGGSTHRFMLACSSHSLENHPQDHPLCTYKPKKSMKLLQSQGIGTKRGRYSIWFTGKGTELSQTRGSRPLTSSMLRRQCNRTYFHFQMQFDSDLHIFICFACMYVQCFSLHFAAYKVYILPTLFLNVFWNQGSLTLSLLAARKVDHLCDHRG